VPASARSSTASTADRRFAIDDFDRSDRSEDELPSTPEPRVFASRAAHSAAKRRGVHPRASTRVGSAPPAKSTTTASSAPARAARCRGVALFPKRWCPFFSFSPFGHASAPARSSVSTTSAWPW